MADIDWTPEEDSFELLEPGIYEVQVKDAEERTSKAGSPYISVKLQAKAFGKFLCFDILMLQGKGRDIGKAKLIALGIPENKQSILAAELIGQCAYVSIGHETYEGKTRAKVNIGVGNCGYWPVSGSPPEGVRTPDAPSGYSIDLSEQAVTDVPF